MTEQPDFTRFPDEVALEQTLAVELDGERWAGPVAVAATSRPTTATDVRA